MITHFAIGQQYCHTLNETNNSLGPQQFLVVTKQWQSTVIDAISSWVCHMCGIILLYVLRIYPLSALAVLSAHFDLSTNTAVRNAPADD